MKYIIVDIESDGPYPGDYSMVCFGAVILEDDLKNAPTFYGETAPISDLYVPEALKISGFNREEHLKFDTPEKTMKEFVYWVEQHSNNDRPQF